MVVVYVLSFLLRRLSTRTRREHIFASDDIEIVTTVTAKLDVETLTHTHDLLITKHHLFRSSAHGAAPKVFELVPFDEEFERVLPVLC